MAPVSDDGHVLIEERFDIDPVAPKRLGFKDFCSLLGLDPDKKYDSTWERVSRPTREGVPAAMLVRSQEQMAMTLLLTLRWAMQTASPRTRSSCTRAWTMSAWHLSTTC